jgi:antirestriction protein ArdC
MANGTCTDKEMPKPGTYEYRQWERYNPKIEKRPPRRKEPTSEYLKRIDPQFTIMARVYNLLKEDTPQYTNRYYELPSQRSIQGIPFSEMNQSYLTTECALCHYDSPFWISEQEANELNIEIPPSAKPIRLPERPRLRPDEETNEKHLNFYNTEQFLDFPLPLAYKFYEPSKFRPIEAADRIIREYSDGPQIEHEDPYSPEQMPTYEFATDILTMLRPERFCTPEDYYKSMFHELAHSTGHKERLARRFGRKEKVSRKLYAMEDIIAELTSLFLCYDAEIGESQLLRSVDYIRSYLSCYLNSSIDIFDIVAFPAALAARDFILNIGWERP